MLKYSYVYDNLNQLTRENNAVANKTYTYTYDDAGNILSKKTYAYTTGTLGSVQSTYSYTYGNSNWGDQLTAFRGASITYDALGNPLSYYNGASFTFTWTNGRQLARTVKGGVTTSYTYNADGVRTGKTVGSSAVEYILNGTKILAEQNGTHSIRYYYDPQGAPVGMNFDGTVYLYEKNLQGDVIGIYTTSGTKVASYTYDAWGNIVSSTYTSGYYNPYYYNPFRYRGYYYDTESGFYYLQSRYYDPATGRFLNADSYINANGDLQGFNMYAYCSNNPVMYVDYTGNTPVGAIATFFASVTPFGWALIATAAVVGIVVLCTVDETAETIKKFVEEKKDELEERDQSVYVLVDPNDGDKVRYVGRTNNPPRRNNEHKKDPRKEGLEMKVVLTGLTKPEAKLAEQVLISTYTVEYLKNARREISTGNLSGFYSNLKAVSDIIIGTTEEALRELIWR